MLRRLLLWDIDGTLVRVGDVGAEVFDLAMEDVVGRRPQRRVAMGGKTDQQIAREYLQQMGIAEEPWHLPAVVDHLERRLAGAAERVGKGGGTCPGVPGVLAAVAADRRVLSSVLTGNIAPNAAVKLGAFGLQRWLDLEVGAYGSDHAARDELVPIALARAVERRGATVGPADVWVIGDTALDLACARAAGARCLLVGTGRTPTPELAALGPDAVLDDLSDTAAVVGLLTGDL